MSGWFERLSADNTDALNALRKINAEEWLRRSAVEKYADATHFIFELLQNADDQEATKVEFTLFPDRVEFRHWGKPFRRNDVEKITRLGDSEKRDDVKKIGCFGIGFKSVFAITDRPEVYCNLDGDPFAFAIENLVVPVALAPDILQGRETLFVLRYAADKAGEAPSVDAAEQLRRAGPETLMFINHVEELIWRDERGDGEWFRCVRRGDGVRTLERAKLVQDDIIDPISLSYRIFHQDVILPTGESSAICTAFKLDANGKVLAEDPPPKLWVFFETEEQTGLRFRMHAPFKLTDNRANIMRKEPFNRILIRELAKLASYSIKFLKYEDRISRETLNAFPLPSPADEIPEVWHPVAESIWSIAKEDAVIPKAAGGYSTPSKLLQGTAEVRSAIDDSDLIALMGQDFAWAVSAGQRNSRIDKLFTHLGLAELNLDVLLKKLDEASSIKGQLQEWLAKHDDEWMQRFYQLLHGIKGHHQVWNLGRLPIIRTADGLHVSASNARFAPTEDRKDPDIEVVGVRLVSPAVMNGRKDRRDQVVEFFKRLGIKEVDERDYIKALLNRHYLSGASVSDMSTHLRHIERFSAWLSEHQGDTSIFTGHSIFITNDGALLYNGTSLFVDSPFQETSLSFIYGPGGPWAGRRKPLAKKYRSVKGALGLALAVGVETRLDVTKGATDGHPQVAWLREDWSRYGTRWGNATNEDWKFSDLKALLETRSPDVALCLWRMLQALPREKLFARFRHAETYRMRECPAHFMHDLRSAEWIPDRSGRLRRPEDMTADQLPEAFAAIDKTGWLEALGFGEASKRQSAEFQEKQLAAAKAGIPDDLIERWAELSDVERRATIEAGLREREMRMKVKPTFPERTSPNPTRRQDRIADQWKHASEKEYNIRERSVRTTRTSIDSHTWLVEYYTNNDRQMICQLCADEMPFKKRDGEYYFVSVEILSREHFSREHQAQFLALCPVCAAKYNEFVKSDDIALAAMKKAIIDADEPAIAVMLGTSAETLRFVEVHFDDLRTILREEIGATCD